MAGDLVERLVLLKTEECFWKVFEEKGFIGLGLVAVGVLKTDENQEQFFQLSKSSHLQ
jgi:hypothetical protein